MTSETPPANQLPEIGVSIFDLRTQLTAVVIIARRRGAPEEEILQAKFAAIEKIALKYGASGSEIAAETHVQRAAK